MLCTGRLFSNRAQIQKAHLSLGLIAKSGAAPDYVVLVMRAEFSRAEDWWALRPTPKLSINKPADHSVFCNRI